MAYVLGKFESEFTKHDENKVKKTNKDDVLTKSGSPDLND